MHFYVVTGILFHFQHTIRRSAKVGPSRPGLRALGLGFSTFFFFCVSRVLIDRLFASNNRLIVLQKAILSPASRMVACLRRTDSGSVIERTVDTICCRPIRLFSIIRLTISGYLMFYLEHYCHCRQSDGQLNCIIYKSAIRFVNSSIMIRITSTS